MLLGLAWILAIATGAAAGDNGKVYIPLDNAMEAVDTTLSNAKEHKKRALIIMGANWCHDSRALATNLQSPEIAGAVADAFEIQYVDVGYLAKNFDINRRFGLPVIFGTPTVLAIDPQTNRLLNRDSVHIWSSAASYSAVETLEKLNALQAQPAARQSEPEALARLTAQIDEFEQQQAQRIYHGYSIVGPMLASYKAGEKPEDFERYWQQLYEMRSQLPRDLQNLRSEAQLRAAAGDKGVRLEFPEYSAFDWEKPVRQLTETK
nr:thioredoxin family protein [Microbulbifer guangxiensis]